MEKLGREEYNTESMTRNERPIAIASASLPPYMAGLPIEAHSLIAEGAGCHIDFWPTRVANIQAKFGLVTTYALTRIRTASQSFRSEKNLKEAWQHPNRLIALVSYLALVHRDDTQSLQAVADMRSWNGNYDTVVTVYEDSDPKALENLSRCEKVVQPTMKSFEKFGVKTEADLDRYLKHYKVSGFCFDTYHSAFLLDNPDLLKAVLRHTKRIDLSLGREEFTDESHMHIDNFQALMDVLHNHQNSPIFNLIKILFDNTDESVPVVLEIPFTSLEKATGLKMDPARLIKLYKHIKNNVFVPKLKVF